jgi:hypothetical protein
LDGLNVWQWRRNVRLAMANLHLEAYKRENEGTAAAAAEQELSPAQGMCQLQLDIYVRPAFSFISLV